MAHQATGNPDPLWQTIRTEAAEQTRQEPMLASYLHATLLNHDTLEDALSFQLATKLDSPTLHAMSMREVIALALTSDPAIGQAVRADILAVKDRDPACRYLFIPLLFFKGFQALQSYRVAHWLWGQGREALALFLQSRISEVFAVDIHPAARIGKGVLIDHATGVVIGETAVVEDNVSMLHQVTLGGTGKVDGDRHPKIRSGVLIGVGAKILGNIEVKEGAKVAAASLVLKEVPAHSTVAGVPARAFGRARNEQPALEMNHRLGGDDGE